MSDELDRIASSLLTALRKDVNLERREFVRGYAPTSEDILGVSVPATRKAARAARSQVRHEPIEVRVRLAQRIIALGFLETRHAAYEILAKDAAHLTKGDLETLGVGMDNWATVDAFSTMLAGPAWIAGRLSDANVIRWARSKNPWWRRAALASTVALNVPARGGHGDAKRTLAICETLAADDHRLVQKALSWSLRSLIRWDATAVRQFLERHETLPRFVRREVETALKAKAP